MNYGGRRSQRQLLAYLENSHTRALEILGILTLMYLEAPTETRQTQIQQQSALVARYGALLDQFRFAAGEANKSKRR